VPTIITGKIKKNKMKKQDNVITGIYKITSPSGKIYIGQSTNIKKREEDYQKLKCGKQPKLYNSLIKHGWEQHIFEIIEECSLEQLNEREIYWGMYYNVLGEDGLNLRLGNSKGKVSEEVKKKIGLANSIPKPKGFGDKISGPNPKKGSNKPKGFKNRISPSKGKSWEWKQKESNYVLQYNIQGVLIKIWPSAKEAKLQTKLKGIHECLRGKTKTSGGYIWKRFTDDYLLHLNSNELKEIKEKKPKYNLDKQKAILIFDKNLNLLYEFESLKEASLKLNKNISNISSALKGKKKNYLNLIWKYKQ